MGEFILKDMVRKRGVEERFEIASAAVSTEEIGNSVYPPARRELQKHGITCDGHAARQITRRDLDHYDRIYYMDRSNARWLERMFPGVWQEKCRPLLEHDVADPWYTGDFQQTWDDICEGCEGILEELC
jgi:protein-tyrosine phosphatase